MKPFKSVIVVLLNLILVAIIGLVVQRMLYEELSSYVKGIREFGIEYAGFSDIHSCLCIPVDPKNCKGAFG